MVFRITRGNKPFKNEQISGTRPVLLAVFIVFVAGALAAGQAPEPVEPELTTSLEPMVPLEKGWKNPPRISRARVYWWWPNSNVTRESITNDLEALKAKGFGGAMITDAAAKEGDVPHGPTFASPEWRDLFVHALNEADRLGLELSLNIQSGWNLGGPDVPTEDASKKLTFSAITTKEGETNVNLPRPDTRGGYYRDEAVVAYPLPSSDNKVDLSVRASVAKSDYPASRAADGSGTTFWVGGNADRAPTEAKPEWIELRFNKPVRATHLDIVPRKGYGPKQARLVAYVDGEAQEIKRFSMNEKTKTLTFDPVSASRWRVIVTDAYDPRQPDNPRNVQIAELTLRRGDHSLMPQTGQPRIQNWKPKAYYQMPGSFTAPKTWHLLKTSDRSAGRRAIDPGDVVHLTDRLRDDGTLEWTVPDGRWEILRFGRTLSGAHVSTHSEGWGGHSIDHLDRGAFKRYWERVLTPLLRDAGEHVGGSLKFVHTDSLELGGPNWTDGMPQHFAQLRGYSMSSFWPALAGRVVENRAVSTRFLNDFRRTLADLIARNKYLTFSRHAHEVHLGIHPESGGPHAEPLDALKNLGRGDVPMGEFWARSKTHRTSADERLFMKQSASAAHTYGKRVVQAEGFTTIGPHWEQDPEKLKPVFDRELTEGLNRLMWHTFPSSPESMGIPGQAYFAGTHLNPNVTWWDQGTAFFNYINRCQFLLQQGLFVGDAVYYYGENIPSFVRRQEHDPAEVLPGYDYDVINTEALLHRTSVDEHGRVVLPDGTRYRILVLPSYNAYSLKTLKHVASLVRSGATVVGKKPSKQYSLRNYPASDRAFKRLARQLWGKTKPGEPSQNSYGNGQVISGRSGRDVLQRLGVQSDLSYRKNDQKTLLNYIHRRTSGADIYFVINRRKRRERVEVSFRVIGKQPELWNPRTGEIRDATAFRMKNGRTHVPITFQPHGSVFVIFRKSINRTSGTAKQNYLTYQQEQNITGPWTVRFDPEWGGPESIVFDSLMEWSQHSKEGVKYYSGEATYVKTFDLPEELKHADAPIWLNLGEVHNLARVTLNGQDLGVTWKTPFRYDVSDAVKPTGNNLQVTVVNLWPNRIIGDRHLPEDQRYTETNVQKFSEESELLPSGLLGPVTIGHAE